MPNLFRDLIFNNGIYAQQTRVPIRSFPNFLLYYKKLLFMNTPSKEQRNQLPQEPQPFGEFFDTPPTKESPPNQAETAPVEIITPETKIAPEQEQSQPKEESSTLEKTIEGLTRRLKKSKKKVIPPIPQVRDEITREVESILEDGLQDAFSALTPVQQQEFKIKGEAVAFEIRDLLKGTRLKVRKVFMVIFDWLKMLPGINRFFLQQEAKIKVDKIVALHEKYKHPYQK